MHTIASAITCFVAYRAVQRLERINIDVGLIAYYFRRNLISVNISFFLYVPYARVPRPDIVRFGAVLPCLACRAVLFRLVGAVHGDAVQYSRVATLLRAIGIEGVKGEEPFACRNRDARNAFWLIRPVDTIDNFVIEMQGVVIAHIPLCGLHRRRIYCIDM